VMELGIDYVAEKGTPSDIAIWTNYCEF